jgi:hypothetical protein
MTDKTADATGAVELSTIRSLSSRERTSVLTRLATGSNPDRWALQRALVDVLTAKVKAAV